MNVGPMSGVVGSAAGAPLSQTTGSDAERAKKDATATQRQVDSETKAEKSSGVGQTEGDSATSDRDADGRRLWEQPSDANNKPEEAKSPQTEPPKQAKDPTGQSGSELDLTG